MELVGDGFSHLLGTCILYYKEVKMSGCLHSFSFICIQKEKEGYSFVTFEQSVGDGRTTFSVPALALHIGDSHFREELNESFTGSKAHLNVLFCMKY